MTPQEANGRAYCADIGADPDEAIPGYKVHRHYTAHASAPRWVWYAGAIRDSTVSGPVPLGDAAKKVVERVKLTLVRTQVGTMHWTRFDTFLAKIGLCRLKRFTALGNAVAQEDSQITQVLGQALGYPWFKDDPENFPDATEEHGVCVGDHVAGSIAAEAAAEIKRLRKAERRRERSMEQARKFLEGRAGPAVVHSESGGCTIDMDKGAITFRDPASTEARFIRRANAVIAEAQAREGASA